jgi:hypothetical protein
MMAFFRTKEISEQKKYQAHSGSFCKSRVTSCMDGDVSSMPGITQAATEK